MVGVCGHKDVSLYASSQGWVCFDCSSPKMPHLNEKKMKGKKMRLSYLKRTTGLVARYA